MPEIETRTVAEWQAAGVLLVEDGNHGESRPRTNEFSETGVAFIRAADLDSGFVSFATASKINDVARGRIYKGVGAPSDILFSHKGTVGKLAFVPDEAPQFVCSPQTTFWRVTDRDRVDPHYLYYYMQSRQFRQQWEACKGETDMADYVSLTAQRRLRVSLPPLYAQDRVVRVLIALDDKIDLNRRMNQALEAMAQALFKSWFVDFDPVVAKREGRQPFGMDAETAVLFPAHFHESEMGPVPEGWTVRGLGHLGRFLNGLALQKYPPNGGDSLPAIKIAELRTEETSKSDRANAAIPMDYIVQNGDLLFSWSGSLLATIWCGGPGALNQHLFKVTSEHFPKWFVYQWIQYHMEDFRDIAAGKATTMGHINRHHLDDAKVVVPSEPVLEAADQLQGHLLDMCVQNKLESRKLEALRDLLLPKLLSGEIQLKDAETTVADV